MKRDKKGSRAKLGLNKESLRQLDPAELQQVGGGAYQLPAYLRTCMGTWYDYYNGG
jgi:hypothetical protein